MSYSGHGSGRNQRAATAVAVALVQGAAIVALVNGLAVHFTRPSPPPPLEGRQIKLEPLPVPDLPEPQKPKVTPRDRPDTARPLPPSVPLRDGPSVPDLPPVPYEPQPPMPEQPRAELPAAEPTGTARAATPRGRSSEWVSTADYPARDLREGNQGITRFTLAIGLDGRVAECRVVRSSGSAGLDAAACEKIRQRARFEPATDADGNRIMGSFSGAIRWLIPRD